jgi:2-iminobutanoate/2-iminopropanoate deaminase
MRFNLTFLSLTLAALLAAALPAWADSPHQYIVTDTSSSRAQLPFSDAVRAGETLYVAGTIGIDPATSQAAGDPKTEAKLAMESIAHTLQAAGYTFEDVVSVQVYCTDIELYGLFNDVYRGYFHGHFPARAFIGVNQLVRGAHFEVMATAVGRGGRH